MHGSHDHALQYKAPVTSQLRSLYMCLQQIYWGYGMQSYRVLRPSCHISYVFLESLLKKRHRKQSWMKYMNLLANNSQLSENLVIVCSHMIVWPPLYTFATVTDNFQLLHAIVQQSQLKVGWLEAIVQQYQVMVQENMHHSCKYLCTTTCKCDHSRCDLKDNRQTCCDCHTRAMSKSLPISPACSSDVTRALATC